MKITKEQQNIEDVTFIIGELNRFGAMHPQEVIRYTKEHRADAFATLPGPRGGILFCGKAAYDRFEEIADRTVKPGSSEAKTFDQRDYVRALREAFAEIFIDGGKPVSQGSVTNLLKRAKQIASQGLVHLTHHIPCVVFYDREPSHFTVGPVTFTRTEQFLSEHDQPLTEYHRSEMEAFAAGLRKRHPELSEAEVCSEATKFADTHIAGIRDYYGDYDWVASVTIPSCHSSISKSRAERTIDAALDVLRLFIPIIPERYRRANAPNTPFKMRELMSENSGRLLSAMHLVSKGVLAGPGWYENLLHYAPPLWCLFETAITTLVAGDRRDELMQRLLDSLNWFGQAVVEPNPSASIVKYTAALERLTITGHIDAGIEERVIKLVALLNSDRTDKSVVNIKDDLGKLYQCRSDLMHGTISPYSPKIDPVLRTGWEITRWSLLQAAQFFGGLRANGKTSREDLGEAYEAWLAKARNESGNGE